MAPDNHDPLLNDAVEAAIARVLAAEVAAREDCARALRDAAELAEQARERVRQLGLRADRRIRTVRAAFEARAASEVAALDAQAEALGGTHDLTPEESAQVERGVAVLARTLTGGAS